MGKQWKQWFEGSKITADGDCSHEIKRRLLLERKAMTNLDSILKSRDITLLTTVCRSYGFSSSYVWMSELDHKEGQELKNWCFWTVVQMTVTVPWAVRRSHQSLQKEINPESSLKGLMLKLKLQYFGHVMWRTDSRKRLWCWERLKAGGEGDDKGWDGWMASPIWWTWVWASSRSCWLKGNPGMLQSMGSQNVRHDWATELNWTIHIYHNPHAQAWPNLHNTASYIAYNLQHKYMNSECGFYSCLLI